VVALVGADAAACAERLGRAANVTPFVGEGDHLAARDRSAELTPDRMLDRAVAAWTEATRVHAPYFVHDADPLGAVADAWTRRFDEEGPVGELEVVVSATLARWRVGSIELPDYYFVLDPESWGVTRRHWYLGVLHGAAPARVLPLANADDAAATLPRLGAGHWWPDLDQLLAGIEHVVPDRAGLTAEAAAQPSASSARMA
jgi:hypothetical protein